jgi:hypothetical protein
MAGSRTASDERLLVAGVVVAVWLASLAAISLLISIAQRAATPSPAAAPPGPALAPVATLPPTVVTAERADAYDCGPGAERHASGRPCAPVSQHGEVASDHRRADAARDAGRGPTP